MVAEYQEKGALPVEKADLTLEGIETYLYCELEAGSLQSTLSEFLELGEVNQTPLPYVAIQAYVPTTDATDAALQKLRLAIRDKYQYATTVGYGPRFLHSTGQLHKGDAGNGLFIQITGEMPDDADIPDNPGEDASNMSFGVLKTSQVLGDGRALYQADRGLIKFHINGDISAGINKLAGYLI